MKAGLFGIGRNLLKMHGSESLQRDSYLDRYSYLNNMAIKIINAEFKQYKFIVVVPLIKN
jgi:hypothetical protein